MFVLKTQIIFNKIFHFQAINDRQRRTNEYPGKYSGIIKLVEFLLLFYNRNVE